MNTASKFALAGAFFMSLIPFAHADSSHHAVKSMPASTVNMSEGEIKKINKESGKLTIKHGELKNLGMPPMTMVFQVSDKTLLDGIKQGQQVTFIAEKLNGKLTVTQLSPLQ